MYEKMRIWIEVDTEAMIEKLKLAKKLCGGRRGKAAYLRAGRHNIGQGNGRASRRFVENA